MPGKKECIVQMEEDFGKEVTVIFCLTGAYKYLYRAGAKLGEEAGTDIAKAKWYFEYASNLQIDVKAKNNRRQRTVDIMFKRIGKELGKYENS